MTAPPLALPRKQLHQRARLKQFPFLSRLDDAMLRELSDSQFATENVSAGRDVVVEGDPGDKFYIIARGRVDVLKRQPDGKNLSLRVLEDGDNFGELALLRDTPRTATIRTLVPCISLTLQRNHFQNLLDHSPEVRAAILAQEAERSASSRSSQTTAPFGFSAAKKT